MARDHDFLIQEASDRHGRMDVFYLDGEQLAIDPTPRPLYQTALYVSTNGLGEPDDWIVLHRRRPDGSTYWAHKGRIADLLAQAPQNPDGRPGARARMRDKIRRQAADVRRMEREIDMDGDDIPGHRGEAAADPIKSPSQED